MQNTFNRAYDQSGATNKPRKQVKKKKIHVYKINKIFKKSIGQKLWFLKDIQHIIVQA